MMTTAKEQMMTPVFANNLLDRLRLDGRVALVTGGAGGMGQAIAASLSEMGATVVLSDLASSVEAVAARFPRATGIMTDITDSASVDRTVSEIVKRHGRLDIAVANAGISYEADTVTHDDATWRRVMAVNLDGAFYTMRAAGRHMVAAGKGVIVGISSITGVRAVRPEVHIGYDVSKAGVAHMCRNLAIEWAKTGVRVNAVAPSYTRTNMLRSVGEERPAVMAQWLADMPIGRLMEPREIADAVAFLASDAASGITGHELLVDGGYCVS
jgi:NAD(P)-dependent dehydrogenase (short-subunit alcohol dehydrogenase family)